MILARGDVERIGRSYRKWDAKCYVGDSKG